MLCSSLEAMVGGALREWKVHDGLPPVEGIPAYPYVIAELRRTHPAATLTELQQIAPAMVEGRRAMLLWALLTVVYARDRMQHGQAYPVTFVPTRAWKHVKLLKGLVILPPAQVYAVKLLEPRPEPASNGPLRSFLKRGLDALGKLGEVYTEAQFHTHLQEFIEQPRCFMECVAIVRMAVVTGYCESNGGEHADARRQIMGHLGWDFAAVR